MIDPVPEGSLLTVFYFAENEMEEGTIVEESNGIRILFQDDWLIVAAKPADLLTHPSYMGETKSLTTLLTPYTLHPVSRLDRDTSGLILLAKNGYAHDRLASVPVQKCYFALVRGCMPETEGLIDAPIARCPDSIITREVRADGQAAQTKYRVLATAEYRDQTVYQMIELELLTGRTHQIRVHCKYLGHPLIGDDLYLGEDLLEADRSLGRQALHAHSLEFTHPISGQDLSLHTEMPADLRQFISESRLIEGQWPDIKTQLD